MKWIFVFGLLVFAAAGCLGPSSKDVSGVYYCQYATYLELNEDRSYEIYQKISGTKLSQDKGTYKLKGNQITTNSDNGYTHEGEIKDDIIVFEHTSCKKK